MAFSQKLLELEKIWKHPRVWGLTVYLRLNFQGSSPNGFRENDVLTHLCSDLRFQPICDF